MKGDQLRREWEGDRDGGDQGRKNLSRRGALESHSVYISQGASAARERPGSEQHPLPHTGVDLRPQGLGLGQQSHQWRERQRDTDRWRQTQNQKTDKWAIRDRRREEAERERERKH